MADRGQAELQELDRVRQTVLAALGGDGMERLQPALLQPAGELLARYGEELRGRACVVSDTHGGELFLLPDYTVPICRMHRERGGGAGQFLYAGPVFRLPELEDGQVPVEEQQAGLEIFEEEATLEADSEVLGRTLAAVRDVAGQLTLTLGDAGIGPAILDTLRVSERRRQRLMRRIGQPQRLQALLARFVRAGKEPDRREDLDSFADPAQGEALLESALGGARHPVHRPAWSRGSRNARLAELASEREEAPLSEESAARVEKLLSLRGAFAPTLDRLMEAAPESPALDAAIRRLEIRATQLAKDGVNTGRLTLDPGLGSGLGYYDGLVFEICVGGRPVAGGGRYDRLAKESDLDLCAVGAAVWIERLLGVSAGRA